MKRRKQKSIRRNPAATPGLIRRAGSLLADSHRASDRGAPLDQPKNPADEEITASIRKKMLDTKMSPNVQNVRVTTQDGVVKLRGTVKSEEEKEKVEEIARATDGATSVDSEIKVE